MSPQITTSFDPTLIFIFLKWFHSHDLLSEAAIMIRGYILAGTTRSFVEYLADFTASCARSSSEAAFLFLSMAALLCCTIGASIGPAVADALAETFTDVPKKQIELPRPPLITSEEEEIGAVGQ